MFVALNSEKERVVGFDAIKGEEYHCQQCHQKVMLKKGEIKTPHFAHYPDMPPCVWWEPETMEHLLMKKRVMNLLKKNNDVAFAQFEYRLNNISEKRKSNSLSLGDYDGFHNDFNGDFSLYPDVYIELRGGERIAVECQVSNKVLTDFILKTKRYSHWGIYTLWLFPHNKDYDAPSSFEDNLNQDDKELRISAMLLQSHRWNYGRIYTMDTITGEEYDINTLQDRTNAVHFNRVVRIPEYNSYAESRGACFNPYYPKTLRFTTSRIIKKHSIFCTTNNGVKIARFYDKKWWGE